MNNAQVIESIFRDEGWVETTLAHCTAGEHVYLRNIGQTGTIAPDDEQTGSPWLIIHAPGGGAISYMLNTAVLRAPRPEPEPEPDLPVGTVAVIRRKGDTREFIAYREYQAQWSALTAYDFNPLYGDAVIVEILGHTDREEGFTRQPDSSDSALSASDSALTNTDDRTDTTPAPLTLTDLRSNPGRIAYDHHTIEVFANPDGRITCQSTTDGEPATCGQPDTHVNLHWADMPEEGQL